MISFESASLSFCFFAFGIFILAILCLVHAWRQGCQERWMFWVILAACLYGYIVEYLSVAVNKQHPYWYNQFIVKLPGPLPLSLLLAWGIIIYTSLLTAHKLGLPRLLQPFFCGFLAVSIDYVLDPVAVYCGFWTWSAKYYDLNTQWFGIPWSNFVGWFVVVLTFLLTHRVCHRWVPPGEKGFWRDFLVAFLAIIPSFLIFMGVMFLYVWIVKLNFVPEELIFFVFFGLCFIPVLLYVPQFKRDNKIDYVIIAVPVFFYSFSLILYFTTAFYKKKPDFIIVLPALALLSFIAFLWPYLDTLRSKKSQQYKEIKSGRAESME